jgi:hypothetical protein
MIWQRKIPIPIGNLSPAEKSAQEDGEMNKESNTTMSFIVPSLT